MTTETCDYVVVGGGAAGCVVASRLAENPEVRVTLLEACRDDRSILLRIPALTFAAIASHEFNWHFETEPRAGPGLRAPVLMIGEKAATMIRDGPLPGRPADAASCRRS